MPYEITGFLDGGTVEISTEPNISTIYGGGHICHSSLVMQTNPMATLSYQNGETSQRMNVVLTEKVDMSKVDPNSFRALIIAPDEDANMDFEITLTTIRDALYLKGISYQELLGKNANWENISVALKGNNLNYVYWIGHTNSQINEERTKIRKIVTQEGIHRTNFKCWDKRKFWSGYSLGKIFSFLKSDGPPELPQIDSLPQDWESRGHSMYSLGLWKTKKIKEFWAVGCESGLEWENAGQPVYVNGLPINDMAVAVGTYYKDQQGNYVHVYMGTRVPVWFGYLIEQLADFPSAVAHIIKRHANNHRLDDALITGPNGSNEHIAIWGRESLDERSIQWWPINTRTDWIYFY